MKKLVVSVLTSLSLLSGVFGLAACGSKTDEHDHVWNNGEITVEATCKQDGVKTYKCTVKGCKESYTENLGKAAHKYDGGVETKPAKCDEEGVKTFTCTECGTTYNEPISKTDHSWDGGTLTVIPSINSKGQAKYVCLECGTDKTESVAPREDFGERFYTSIAEQNAWSYGYAENFNQATGGFEFVRIMQTDEQQPAVWKADGVSITANEIYAEKNAAIAYSVTADMQLNISISFGGEDEQTRVAAYLVVVGSNGEIKNDVIPVSKDSSEWNFSTEEELAVSTGDSLYLIFNNAGNGFAGGKLGCTLTTPCIHMWDEGEETKQASCTENGEITYTCDKCGDTTVEITPKANHIFEGEWVKVSETEHARKCLNCTAVSESRSEHAFVVDETKRVPSTCTDYGTDTLVCGDCGATKTESLTELAPHDFTGDWVNVSAAGHAHGCVNCQAVSNILSDHNYIVDETKRVPSTCTDYGTDTLVCDGCGAITTEKLTELAAHDFTGGWIKTDTVHYHVCSNEGCTAESEKVPHQMKEVEKVEATEDSDGYVKKQCETCGYESTVDLPALTHTKGDTLVYNETHHWYPCTDEGCDKKFDEAPHAFATKLTEQCVEATCKEDGKEVWACECGATEERIISKDTVAHGYEYKIDGDTHYQECSVCGAKTDSADHSYTYEKTDENHTGKCVCGKEITEAHDWDDGEITKQPTCSEAGEKTYTCLVCRHTKTEPVTVGHTYEDKSSESGHWQECSVCGNKTDVAAHEWDEGVITVKPTLTASGVKTYTCTYGETREENVEAKNSTTIAEDFSLTDPGAWKYGYTAYRFGDSEDFDFHASAETSSDAWITDGNEIKAGWLNSGNWATIGYTVTENVTVKINMSVNCGPDNSALSLRIGVKRADGSTKFVPDFIANSHDFTVDQREYTLEAGDTIYFMFNNEGTGEGAFPQADYTIELIKVQ